MGEGQGGGEEVGKGQNGSLAHRVPYYNSRRPATGFPCSRLSRYSINALLKASGRAFIESCGASWRETKCDCWQLLVQHLGTAIQDVLCPRQDGDRHLQ